MSRFYASSKSEWNVFCCQHHQSRYEVKLFRHIKSNMIWEIWIHNRDCYHMNGTFFSRPVELSIQWSYVHISSDYLWSIWICLLIPTPPKRWSSASSTTNNVFGTVFRVQYLSECFTSPSLPPRPKATFIVQCTRKESQFESNRHNRKGRTEASLRTKPPSKEWVWDRRVLLLRGGLTND